MPPGTGVGRAADDRDRGAVPPVGRSVVQVPEPSGAAYAERSSPLVGGDSALDERQTGLVRSVDDRGTGVRHPWRVASGRTRQTHSSDAEMPAPHGQLLETEHPHRDRYGRRAAVPAVAQETG